MLIKKATQLLDTRERLFYRFLLPHFLLRIFSVLTAVPLQETTLPPPPKKKKKARSRYISTLQQFAPVVGQSKGSSATSTRNPSMSIKFDGKEQEECSTDTIRTEHNKIRPVHVNNLLVLGSKLQVADSIPDHVRWPCMSSKSHRQNVMQQQTEQLFAIEDSDAFALVNTRAPCSSSSSSGGSQK